MPLSNTQRVWVQRAVAVVLAVLIAPLLAALAVIFEAEPIVAGEPAPRTVEATQLVRIVDEAATEAARARARDSVDPVLSFDPEAQANAIADVREVFEAVTRLRSGPAGASEGPVAPSAPDALSEANLSVLGPEGLRLLLGLSETQLSAVERATVQIAQNLARLRIAPNTAADGPNELDQVLDERLPTELALATFPSGVPDEMTSQVVEPVIRQTMRPTVQELQEATAAAREQAAEAVPETVVTWRQGEVIVRAGQIPSDLQIEALEQLGLEGTDARVAYARGLAVMGVVTLVVMLYLRRMAPEVWTSGRLAMLLGSLAAAFALLASGVAVLADTAGTGWWFAAPVSAFAMLLAILVRPVVGAVATLPAIGLLLLVGPPPGSVLLYVVAVVLATVPLVSDLTSRGDLRRATVRAALLSPLIAVTVTAAFGSRDDVVEVGLAALAGGIAASMLVQGLLPFLETSFRLPTVTALLDLADRNHPLLRELENTALGSYNHSVMVASLVERACRRIGANALLGHVAALYHDIGKVQQPLFFIENQQGIRNPHDDLEPEVSAVIIQNHVIDGVEMAEEHRLPPEVVSCIGSHHGTMIVTYFYRQALDRAGGDLQKVDVDHFRYKGHKPRRKEAAVLLMADCCEAATRSAAMTRGTLPRDEIESMVDRLLQERLDDGQFDDCDLTFAELSTVRDSIVDALVGIYHPRIAYPGASADAAR